MSATPKVTSETSLANSFLGDTIQVCVVTKDMYRTMDGMVKLGIGPWRVYEFNSQNCKDMTFRGQPANYSMKLCLAFSGTMMWEIIEPIIGPSIYTEFLAKHGEGIHHVAQGCNNGDWEERKRSFTDKGFKMIQSGTWSERVPYAYFETEDAITTTIEIFDIPGDFALPEPLQWYPAKP